MKFRYKVLLVNIIILAITLAVSGFFMVSRQNRILMDAQIKNSVTENNLVESTIEYSLLDVINNNIKRVKIELPDIADRVSAGMLSSDTELFIGYDSDLIFLSDSSGSVPQKLLEKSSTNARKKYQITEEKKGIFIYVVSFVYIEENAVTIITKRNITDTQNIINTNIYMLRIFIVLILMISGIIVYFLSLFLTRPLEKLNRVTDDFAEGDFTIRSNVNSQDEVGLLSDKFNHMADAVEGHIEELNDMIHRRDQFVVDFTHEIKTPMTTIIGYADTIRSMELPREDEVKAAGYIFTEGKRLEQMSSHLFDLIYLKEGEIPKQAVNTQALGEVVVDTVLPSIEAAGLTLRADFESETVEGDSALLKTAFINLLDNARKAVKVKNERMIIEEGSDSDDKMKNNEISFTGKVIEVKEKAKLRYEYVVEDHGIGIAPQDIDRICDEFYMVDKSRSRSEGGAGLGMSLVAAILKEHSAELRIESEVGAGTRMIVTMDIA